MNDLIFPSLEILNARGAYYRALYEAVRTPVDGKAKMFTVCAVVSREIVGDVAKAVEYVTGNPVYVTPIDDQTVRVSQLS